MNKSNIPYDDEFTDTLFDIICKVNLNLDNKQKLKDLKETLLNSVYVFKERIIQDVMERLNE
jgi:hypothetical protein